MVFRSEVTLAADQGSPDIVTIVGQANYAGYDLYLWDSPTHYINLGGNDGTQPLNRFSLQFPPEQLTSRRFVWQGKVRAFGSAPNQPFAITCHFYQNNTLVTSCNPAPEVTGKFSSTYEVVVIICSFKV